MSLKTGSLTVAEKYFIEGNSKTMTAEEIGIALQRSTGTVTKHLNATVESPAVKAAEKAKVDNEEARQKAAEDAAIAAEIERKNADIATNRLTVDQLMGRKREAVIMTPAASQQLDDIRKHQSMVRKNRFDSSIHKIRDKK